MISTSAAIGAAGTDCVELDGEQPYRGISRSRHLLVETGGSPATGTPRQHRNAMSEEQLDEQLVERAQTGDKRAFELLVRKYQYKIIQLVGRARRRRRSADVAQETFIKAYRALNGSAASAFYTWLYRIGINTAKNHLRRAAGVRADHDIDVPGRGTIRAHGHLSDMNTPEPSSPRRSSPRWPRRSRSAAAGPAAGHHLARAGRPVVRGDRTGHGLPDRHGAITDFPGPRGDRRRDQASDELSCRVGGPGSGRCTC